MTQHILKTHPMWMPDLISGAKTVEFRKNDRGYKVGDELHLQAWDDLKGFHGPIVPRRITHIVDHAAWPDVPEGWAILSLGPVAGEFDVIPGPGIEVSSTQHWRNAAQINLRRTGSR